LGQCVLGIGAVDRLARVLLVGAEGFSSRCAVLASAAGVSEPGNGHPISLGQIVDTRSRHLDNAHTFVPGNEGRIGLDGPVPWAAWVSVWHSSHVSIFTNT
jgi:molybdopterin/thiamine biosynthesis adenylyltransferase